MRGAELRCLAAKNFQTVENDREKIWDGIARFAFARTRTWNRLKALVRGQVALWNVAKQRKSSPQSVQSFRSIYVCCKYLLTVPAALVRLIIYLEEFFWPIRLKRMKMVL